MQLFASFTSNAFVPSWQLPQNLPFVSVAMSIQFWPAASGAIMYVLMAFVLLVRPRGLLGERWERFE